MNGQVYSEIGGHIKLEDSRSAPMALPNGIAAPWVKPTADNNFVLANARNGAVREHALGNRSSSFGQGECIKIFESIPLETLPPRLHAHIVPFITELRTSPADAAARVQSWERENIERLDLTETLHLT
jgi:hypothetical protein